jgi:hypothetical protein
VHPVKDENPIIAALATIGLVAVIPLVGVVVVLLSSSDP